MNNWPRTVNNALGLLAIAGFTLAAFAWFVILPTVGLLYSFGVLP